MFHPRSGFGSMCFCCHRLKDGWPLWICLVFGFGDYWFVLPGNLCTPFITSSSPEFWRVLPCAYRVSGSSRLIASVLFPFRGSRPELTKLMRTQISTQLLLPVALNV